MTSSAVPTTPAAFQGRRPLHEGHLVLETQGIAPIPEDTRYGSSWRNFTVWFAPNVELSGVFTGTIAASLGLGFGLGVAALVIGVVLGSLPVALLATWGPKTGMAQIPLARLAYGRSIVVPGAVQWATAIAWDALVGLFGAEAAQEVFHVPFVAGILVVLAVEGLFGFLGYEVIHQLQRFGSVILAAMFVVVSVTVVRHGITTPAQSVSGGAAVGAFVWMTAIAVSGAFSWATYAADYSRYQAPTTAPRGVFAGTFAGLAASFVWTYVIGLAAVSALSDQTAAGFAQLVGGGALGTLALLAVLFGAVTSNAMNDYSSSLAVQAAGVRLRRNWTALLGTGLAFVLMLWLHSGDLTSKFQSVLLLTGYWVAPFLAVVLIDWRARRGRVTAAETSQLMTLGGLPVGGGALLATLAGFAAMVPFMNLSPFFEGPVAGGGGG
ncbi:MAG: purine-cytosine permease family protein, partial [Candidatus Dormibacteria bacterium]